MTDCLNVPYAERNADPSEPGVHLTFGEGEWAQWQGFLNRGAAGAAYDATTRVGCPLVGQGGGVYVADDAGSYVQGAVYAAGVAMAGEHQVDALPAAARIVAQNGAQHLARVDAAGQFEASLNSGVTYSTAAWNMVGRGPFHWAITHDGASQRLWINRRLADSDAVALGVPAGNIQVGRTGTARRVRLPPTQPNVTAMYLQDFAKRVVYQWKPSTVGEGPAGGIPTGAVGEGDWSCPSGGASLAFVWVRDLSVLGGGYLALTDSGALSMRRLALTHTKMPAFGTWRFRFKLRDPATDNPRFGIVAQRDQDFTAAGSDGYWWQVQRAAGVMRATMHEANGAAMLTVNSSAAGAAGDACELHATRDVSGDFRLWLRVGTVWAGTAATVANDVTSLSTNYISIAPRQSYVSGVTRHQGEMTPAELP